LEAYRRGFLVVVKGTKELKENVARDYF